MEKISVKNGNKREEYVLKTGINIICGRNASGKTRLLRNALMQGANFVDVNKLTTLSAAKEEIEKIASKGKTLLIDDLNVIPKAVAEEVIKLLEKTGLQAIIATPIDLEIEGANKIQVDAK
jgi:AAA15 family ATPase/GTPase